MRLNREYKATQLLLRSWPFPRGAGRLTDRLFSKLRFSEEIANVITTDGFQLRVMPNELIGRHLYLTGEFDRSTVEILLRLSKPGDTLLDIGANVGYVGGCFLQNVPNSSVIAVEPQFDIFELLKHNLGQFSSRAQMFNVAVSDRDGTLNLSIDLANRGASKLAMVPGPNTRKVSAWTPTTLLEEARSTKIDLVKIDVEGHEEEILRAMEFLLQQHVPRAIVYEDHTAKSAPEEEIGMILGRCGYRVFGVKKGLTNLELVPIFRKADCVYNDYVAERTLI